MNDLKNYYLTFQTERRYRRIRGRTTFQSVKIINNTLLLVSWPTPSYINQRIYFSTITSGMNFAE